MRRTEHHLDADVALRYVMGDSPAGETAELEEHLLLCVRCREQLSSEDRYFTAMSEAAGEIRAAGADREGGWQLLRLLQILAGLSGLALLGMLAARYH